MARRLPEAVPGSSKGASLQHHKLFLPLPTAHFRQGRGWLISNSRLSSGYSLGGSLSAANIILAAGVASLLGDQQIDLFELHILLAGIARKLPGRRADHTVPIVLRRSELPREPGSTLPLPALVVLQGSDLPLRRFKTLLPLLLADSISRTRLAL